MISAPHLILLSQVGNS